MAGAPDIQVIVIDPVARTVDKRWIPNKVEAMQELVGGWIQAVYPEALGGECLYCNEDGKSTIDLTHSFTLRTFEHDQIHGASIILGTDDEGNSASTAWSAEEIADFITWPDGSSAWANRTDHTEALEALPGYGSF